MNSIASTNTLRTVYIKDKRARFEFRRIIDCDII